jgi:hypothetical protein
MTSAEEIIKKIKDEAEKQRDKTFNDIVKDIPVQAIAMQPALAAQMIFALRGSLNVLKMIDPEYEFKLGDAAGYTKGRPDYIG